MQPIYFCWFAVVVGVFVTDANSFFVGCELFMITGVDGNTSQSEIVDKKDVDVTF